MTRVGWHPLARRELFESLDFYEREVAALGQIFLGRVERAIEKIRLHPRSGSPILGDLRKQSIHRFPYDLIYRVEAERVVILAVAHQKRRPNYWISRR